MVEERVPQWPVEQCRAMRERILTAFNCSAIYTPPQENGTVQHTRICSSTLELGLRSFEPPPNDRTESSEYCPADQCAYLKLSALFDLVRRSDLSDTNFLPIE